MESYQAYKIASNRDCVDRLEIPNLNVRHTETAIKNKYILELHSVQYASLIFNFETGDATQCLLPCHHIHFTKNE